MLVSRKWSGKALADHRADRQQWLLETLGVSATDPARYAWEAVEPGDPDHMDHARRLLHAVADRAMRPGEVKALRKDGCYLPASGWGKLTLSRSRPQSNKRWTDSGEAFDDRG